MIYLSLEQIIELHDALIEKFGGLIGIRERGLLESAVATPMMAVFGDELHKTIYNKAAAYLFYIAKIMHFLMETKELQQRRLWHFLELMGSLLNMMPMNSLSL